MTRASSAALTSAMASATPPANSGRSRARTALLVLAAWTLYGVFYGILWKVTSGLPDAAWGWVFQVTIALSWFWALLTPGIVWLTRQLERAQLGLARTILVHAVAAIVVAFAVTVIRRAFVLTFWPFPDPLGPLIANALYWLDVNVLTYLTVVGIGRALDLHQRYRERTARTHLLEAQLSRAQLQFLELQLQPHFLFNCLNTISELAHEAPATAELMLRQLHALLRVSLERAGEDEVSLGEELASLEPYIAIQRMRFSEWLTVEHQVEPAVRDALIPHLILQPLVENAIRHGLAVRAAPGRVVIEARVIGDRLLVRVADNGVGLSPAKSSHRPGIGLRNAKNRLTQLYGPAHRFDLLPAPGGGVVVELEIPFRSRQSVADTPAPDWSATGEWSTAPQRIWSTPSAGVPIIAPQSKGVNGAAALEQPRFNGLAPDQVFADTSPLAPTNGNGHDAHDTGELDETLTRANALVNEPVPRPGRESPRLSLRTWLAVLAFWLGCGLFWSQQVYFYVLARGRAELVTLRDILGTHLVSAAVWAALTPVVLFLARRLRIGRRNWPTRLPLHALGSALTALAHVWIMREMRITADVPLISFYNLNQILGNIFIYLAILAWSHSRDFYAWYRQREVASARLEAEIARSRYQALCVQLRPHFLLGTLDLLTRLVHEDVPQAERLITRLADVLRLTLDAAGERETTLRREIELLKAYVEVYRQGIRREARLSLDIPADTLGVTLPNRLLRTLVDDLLTGLHGSTDAEVEIAVDAERVTGATRIRVRAIRGSASEGASRPLWTETVEAATLAERDRSVSLFFPDSTTAIVVLAEPEEASSRARGWRIALTAQPA